MFLADEAAVWARGVAQQCRSSATPVNIGGSFEAFAGVFNSVETTVASHAHLLVEKLFAAQRLLHRCGSASVAS